MLVTDRTLAPLDRLPEVVEAAVDGGVDAVQVRERGLQHPAMLRLGKALRAAIADRARLLVNDARQIAAVFGADGVHLPEVAPGIKPAQRHGLIVGRSVHSSAAALRAQDEGCDYIVLGTVFPSRTHPGGPTGGLGLVREVCGAVRIPVLGIGGITRDNAGDVIRAGASGVAVISAILGAADPRAAARELRDEIDAALGAGVGEQR